LCELSHAFEKNYKCVKTLNFEQMEQVEGGSTYSWICGGIFGVWGGVLSYAAMSIGPVGWALTAVWTGIGYVACNAEDFL